MIAYTSLFPSFLLLLPLIFLPWLIWKRNKKPDNNKANLPPTPPKLPIIGNLHQLGNLRHRSLQKLSEKYGPIFLMQFGQKPTLIVSSAEIAKEVLKTQDLNFCSRPILYGPKRLSYNLRDFAFAPYGDYWREMRKLCVLELFSAKRVQSFKFVREEEVANMIKIISNAAASSSPVDLTETLFSLTSQITCSVAFGNSYRDFNAGKFTDAIYEAMDMLGSFAATDFFPYFGWIVDYVSGLSTRLEKIFNTFDVFYQQIIDEHLDPTKQKTEQDDIIDILLGIQKDQTSVIRLTTSDIKAILMNIFLAGVDTSAITMVWAMTELAKKPVVMKKVQEEIRKCVGRKGKVEESDIEQLNYFKMVVKETLRLHPPSILLIPHESMNHCKINGYDIYPKTRVFVNVWAIGRSSDWENPEDFYPERFMDNSIDFRGQDFEFLPFGSGRRICPAISMGVAMIELGLANLLYCFDWVLPSGMMKEDINMEEIAGLTVHKKFPLQLVPIKKTW
ncbi:hypothetical protein ACHQM5_015361 [Ranunculus cassubicifolius]